MIDVQQPCDGAVCFCFAGVVRLKKQAWGLASGGAGLVDVGGDYCYWLLKGRRKCALRGKVV